MNGSLSAKFAKNFSRKNFSMNIFRYMVHSVLLFWHAKVQEVPCGPQDLWDYTFAD